MTDPTTPAAVDPQQDRCGDDAAYVPITAHQAERLRKQLAFLTRGGQSWRTVLTDSESADGIALRCTSPEHPDDDKLQQWGVYDCCDYRPIETYSEQLAAFFVSATIAVPAMLAELEQLVRENAELRSKLDTRADIISGLDAELERLRAERDELQDQLDRARHSAKQCTATNTSELIGTVRCGMPAGHGGEHLVERYDVYSRWTNQAWGAGWAADDDAERQPEPSDGAR